MSFPVEAYRADIAQIVENVFLTMLEKEISPPAESPAPISGAVTAAIFFAGTWKGAVLVECSEQLARHWTSQLMSIPRPADITDDVRDSLGEIVNMIGGNLKSVLPPGVGLSMPSVVQGKDYVMKVCGSNLVSRQSFSCADGPFWVTLVEVIEE